MLARLYEDRAALPNAALILCVHDEIVLEVDEGDAERAATWLKEHMLAAGRAWISSVPVEVDVTIARDWSGAT